MRKIIVCLFILLTFVISAYSESPSIDELNPDFEAKIAAATKTKPRFGDPLNVWSMFLFADIHSDAMEFSRLLEFYGKYEKYFDEIYCAGDIMWDSLQDDFSFWSKTPLHEKVLMCIGNHDVVTDPKHRDKKYQVSEEDTYNFFFKPFIKNWNCVYEEGHTYYYKDYDKNKLRLITLDSMLFGESNQAQEKWFNKIVNDTLQKEYALLVITHCPVDRSVKIKSNFTQNVDEFHSMWDNLEGFQNTIDKFIEQGGEFVCWVGGHVHCDSICYNANHPKQLNILIDAASIEQCNYHSDVKRVKNTRSEDLANAFIINFDKHQIKMIRIGANVGWDLIPRNTIVIDYKTFEIISNS